MFVPLCAVCLFVCSCAHSPAGPELVYGFVCSTDDAPVAGYRFLSDKNVVASSNANGFFSFPRGSAEPGNLVGRKSGWETVRIDVSSLSSEQVLCIQVRSVHELFAACEEALSCGAYSAALDVARLMDVIPDGSPDAQVASVFRAVSAYRAGFYEEALEALGNVPPDDAKVSRFLRLVEKEVLGESETSS